MHYRSFFLKTPDTGFILAIITDMKQIIFATVFLWIISWGAAAMLVGTAGYPTPSYGAKDTTLNTILPLATVGYKTRFIDAFSTGLVHIPSQVISGISTPSVSEGSGYGLLIFLWSNSSVYFDALWNSVKARQQRTDKLFSWLNTITGNIADTGAATDADEDIALALVFADRLKSYGYAGWATSTINYGSEAKAIINAIYENEISGNYVLPDNYKTPKWNASYFSPATYKVFAEFDNSSTHNWKTVIDQNYALLNLQRGAAKGLAPDWCSLDGVTSNNNPTGMQFGYDAIRVPYRLALDSIWYGETRAQSFLNTAMAWVAPSQATMYELDGSTFVPSNNAYHNELTIGMWAAGAWGSTSASAKTAFLAEMKTQILSPTQDSFGTWSGAKNLYYNQSLGWLGSAVMNGSAVNVFSDLNSPPRIITLSVGAWSVATSSSLSLVVSDNEGWNSIRTLTLTLMDKNGAATTFSYTNDWGQRVTSNTHGSWPSGLPTMSLSGSGSSMTQNFNIQIQDLNFSLGTINIAVSVTDGQGQTVTCSALFIYTGVPPSPGSVGQCKTFPNPFNPWSSDLARQTIKLEYKLGSDSAVDWQIYDLTGHRVYQETHGSTEPQGLSSGLASMTWNGRDLNGQQQTGGLYFWILRVNGQVGKTGKIILWHD